MNRLIIVGSPRIDGRSANLAELLFESCIEEHPDEEVALAPVSTLDVAPCEGCNWCRLTAAGQVPEAGEGATEDGAASETADEEGSGVACAIQDDMAELYGLIDAADELIVVSPVYFASAPAQLKALLDRLQPYYWTDARRKPKRPATLHVVGEGGDPHGFDPLIGQVRSALSVAGFELVRVLDWVGKIDDEGEITDEATEYVAAPASLLGSVAFVREGEPVATSDAAGQAGKDAAPARPRLNLPDSRQKAASQVYGRPEDEAAASGKDSGKQRKGQKGRPSGNGKPANGGKPASGKGSGKRGSGKGGQSKGSGRGGNSAGSGRGPRSGR